MKKIKCVFPIILIIFFIIGIVPKEFQNDTFFTIAIGEEIFKGESGDVNSLVWHDNIEFVHSGYFDQIIYYLYNNWGFFGIYFFVIILSSILALIYYNIINSICNNRIISTIITIIIVSLIKYFLTARAQIISSTLFLIEFYCLEKITAKPQKRYFIVLCIIPFIIANLHASVFPIYFVIYMPYLLEFILYKLDLKSTEESKFIIRKIEFKYVIILFLLGILFGLMTPTGLEPFTDMFKATTDVARNMILELKPINLIDNIYFTMMLVVVISIIAFSKTKIRITDFLFIFGFALLAMYTKRCVFYFYLISSICTVRTIDNFFLLYKINLKFKNEYIKKVFIVLVYILGIVYSAKLITDRIEDEYVDCTEFPIDAANYIIYNLDIENMKIYNHFNFGSYLEFMKIPVFIDSRSGIYTEEFNEGCTVLKDWYNTYIGGVSYKKTFDKYNITHALLHNSELINLYIKDDPDWKLIYQDDAFSLYEKVN